MREVELQLREERIARADKEETEWQKREREMEHGRMATERELEKARAEIYALQVHNARLL